MWTVAAVIFAASTAIGALIVQNRGQPSPPGEASPTLIGTPLPPFSLKAVDGVVENAAQWQGKVQIINFWATWCAPCQREIPELIKLQNQYRDRGLQVIGIALDDVESVKTYIEEHGINYPILVGERDVIDVAEQLGNGIGILPYTVIADRVGNISFVRFGEVSGKAIESEIQPLL